MLRSLVVVGGLKLLRRGVMPVLLLVLPLDMNLMVSMLVMA